MHSILSKKIIESGAGDVGFSINKSPFEGLENTITIVVPLSNPVIEQIENAPTKTYFHHYRTVNAFIDNIAEKTVLYIMSLGYDAAAIPASQSVDKYSGLFPHKTAAVRAGLGYIGKSALFISNKYGARVRLGTVFTNMPLPENQFVQVDKCGKCDICVRACPAMAISGKTYLEGMEREEIFDAIACSNYMKREFQHIGRGAVCGICIKNCPKGLTKNK